jgi:hypothetical protein
MRSRGIAYYLGFLLSNVPPAEHVCGERDCPESQGHAKLPDGAKSPKNCRL